MDSFNIWEEANENNKLWRRNGMKSLLRKYKGVIDDNALSFGEDILFKMTKSQYDEALSEYREEEQKRVQRQTRAEADLKAQQQKREEDEFSAEQKRQPAEESIKKQTQNDDEYSAEVMRRRKKAVENPPMMKRDNSYGARVAEGIAKSSAAHATAVAAQGVSESLANPAGLALRTYNFAKGKGFNTGFERVEPKNNFERGLEMATSVAYASVLGSAIGGALSTSKTVTQAAMSSNKFSRVGAKFFQYLAMPGGEGMQIGAAAGGAALPAMVGLKEPDRNASLFEKAKSTVANWGMNILGSVAAGGVGSVAHHVLKRHAINKGIKKFKKELITQEYEEVKLGEFSRKALAEINEIRLKEGQSLMRNNNLMIPANVVKHIYEGRVVKDGVNVEEVARTMKKAFYSKNTNVSHGKWSHIQEFRSKGNNIGAVGYIAINPANKKNVVKTVFAKKNKRISD